MELTDKVGIIESMELDVGPKTNMILVAAGQKPACSFEVRYCDLNHLDPDGNVFRISPGFYQTILSQLDDLDISFELGPTTVKGIQKDFSKAFPGIYQPKVERVEFFFGPKSSELKRIPLPVSNASDHVRMGRVLGYPETAIHTFAYNFDKLVQNIPQTSCIYFLKDQSEEVFRFLYFRPSQEHFEEEMRTARRWQETIRSLSPLVYDKVINFYERVHSNTLPEEIGKFLYTELG